MQSEIIIQAVFISLFTMSIYLLSLKGWPLSFYRKIIYKLLGVTFDKVQDEHIFKHPKLKPLWKVTIGCPPCMSSLYGILLFILFIADYSINGLILCIFSILLAGGINMITQVI